jgi:tetrahydrodipicolinate N-succinyltransferase
MSIESIREMLYSGFVARKDLSYVFCHQRDDSSWWMYTWQENSYWFSSRQIEEEELSELRHSKVSERLQRAFHERHLEWLEGVYSKRRSANV